MLINGDFTNSLCVLLVGESVGVDGAEEEGSDEDVEKSGSHVGESML